MRETLGIAALVLVICVLINFGPAAGSYVNCRQDGGVTDVCLADAGVLLLRGDGK